MADRLPVSAMPPGTIIRTERGLILRRRPLATIGLPWKSKGGVRYDHAEVAALAAVGSTVSLCQTCVAGQLCLDHDAAHLGSMDSGSKPPCCEHHLNRSNGMPCDGACCQDCPGLGGGS